MTAPPAGVIQVNSYRQPLTLGPTTTDRLACMLFAVRFHFRNTIKTAETPMKPHKTTKTTTIDAAGLTELTGLTDRRHRQLAAEGWFAPPVNGRYILRDTIRGLLRRHAERTGTMEETRQARLTKLQEEAALLVLERQQKEGIVLPYEDALGVVRETLLPLRQRLSSLAADCASFCNPVDPLCARAVLDDWVAATLPLCRTPKRDGASTEETTPATKP